MLVTSETSPSQCRDGWSTGEQRGLANSLALCLHPSYVDVGTHQRCTFALCSRLPTPTSPPTYVDRPALTANVWPSREVDVSASLLESSRTVPVPSQQSRDVLHAGEQAVRFEGGCVEGKDLCMHSVSVLLEISFGLFAHLRSTMQGRFESQRASSPPTNTSARLNAVEDVCELPSACLVLPRSLSRYPRHCRDVSHSGGRGLTLSSTDGKDLYVSLVSVPLHVVLSICLPLVDNVGTVRELASILTNTSAPARAFTSYGLHTPSFSAPPPAVQDDVGVYRTCASSLCRCRRALSRTKPSSLVASSPIPVPQERVVDCDLGDYRCPASRKGRVGYDSTVHIESWRRACAIVGVVSRAHPSKPTEIAHHSLHSQSVVDAREILHKGFHPPRKARRRRSKQLGAQEVWSRFMDVARRSCAVRGARWRIRGRRRVAQGDGEHRCEGTHDGAR